MSEKRASMRTPWAKFIVLAVVLADCVGIYYANKRLNQPWVEPAGVPAEGSIAQADESPAVLDMAMQAPAAIPPSAMPDETAKEPAALARLPEFMPVPPVLKEEQPASIPTVEMVLRQADLERPRMARLQPSRKASRRFVSAFATDIAGSATEATFVPSAALNAAAPAAADTAQIGSDGGPGEIGAPESSMQSQSEAPVEIQDGQGVDVQPPAELPAADPGPEAELPAG